MDPFQSHLDALDEGVGHQEEHPRHAWVQGAGPRHGSHRGRAKMEQLLNMDTTLLTEYIRLHDWQMQRGREEKDFVCQPSRSGSPCSRSNTSANASPQTSAVIHICSLSWKVSLLMVGSI